jgi:hypothetical protein
VPEKERMDGAAYDQITTKVPVAAREIAVKELFFMDV